MKRLALFLIYYLVFYSLSSQNCNISDSLNSLSLTSAKMYVYTEVRNNPQHLYYDSIHFPEHELEQFIFWISAIYEQSEDEEFNEIFIETEWALDGYKYKRPFDFIIEAPLNSNFLDTLDKTRSYSGLPELDSLINLYNLHFKYVNDLESSTVAYFTVQNIFYENIEPIFETIDELTAVVFTLVRHDNQGNCYGDIEIINSMNGDTVILKMIDKMDTSSVMSFWKYYISSDCNAQLIDKSYQSCKNTVSIIENETELNIYPNPTSNKVFINTDEEIKFIELYNLVGKKYPLSLVKNGNSYEVDVSFLNDGVYFLFINSRSYKILKN